MEMLTIDGSYGEGGGSILRLATALSAITKKPIEVIDIRKNRPVSGLKEQHLQAIKAVADMCNGNLKNAFIGSERIEFCPEEISKSKLNVRIGTAGSIGLLLQSLMLPCFFAKKSVGVEIRGGGTLGLWSPNLLYTKNVFLPLIKKMGFNMDIDIKRHGFFPKGGADVTARIKPAKGIKPILLEERGNLNIIHGISIASMDLENADVSERTSRAARQILKDYNIEIQNLYTDTLSTGSGLILFAEYDNCIIGWDSLGERGKKAEVVGQEAALGLLKQMNSNGTVDEYASDQILVFMAFCSDKSIIRIPKLTGHAKTNIWLIEKFLQAKFSIRNNLIECNPL